MLQLYHLCHLCFQNNCLNSRLQLVQFFCELWHVFKNTRLQLINLLTPYVFLRKFLRHFMRMHDLSIVETIRHRIIFIGRSYI